MSDKAEFAALFEQYGQMLFRVANALLRNRQEAEDAVQDAMLKLYRTGAWKNAANERAFLARTAWRAALDRCKRPQHSESLDDPGSTEGLTIASRAPSPEMFAIEGDQQALLSSLIDELPLEMRAPLLLAAIEGMTTREVAESLSLNETTVRTRIHRARAELRRRFEAAQRRTKGGLR